MNNKGFAISIILYSMIFLLIAIFYILLGIVRTRYIVNSRLRESIIESLNKEGLAIDMIKRNVGDASCNPTIVDDMGTEDTNDDIIYFSGTSACVNMNYVVYSGKMWRITAIYPDGSMKLVSQDLMTSLYYADNNQIVFGSNTYVYQWLNEDFYDTLYQPDEFLDTIKKWDTSETRDEGERLSGTRLVSSNVGLLTSYELYQTYRNLEFGSDSYLHNGYSYWLLNTEYNSTYDNRGIWSSGYTSSNDEYLSVYTPDRSLGVRPAINLKSGLFFTGDGTINSPYRIIGDKEIGKANERINTRLSGEYIKLKNGNNEKIFKIVGVEDSKTKIMAVDYADDVMDRQFASGSYDPENDMYGKGLTTTEGADTWYNFLNGTYYENLVNTYGSLFTTGTYYLGRVGSASVDYSYSYKLSICESASRPTKTCTKTSTTGEYYVGLPRMGEMHSTQQLSQGYNENTGRFNSKTMYLITPGYASNTKPFWLVNYSADDYPDSGVNALPTLHLKSTVKIRSGSGTKTDPYIVGL